MAYLNKTQANGHHESSEYLRKHDLLVKKFSSEEQSIDLLSLILRDLLFTVQCADCRDGEQFWRSSLFAWDGLTHGSALAPQLAANESVLYTCDISGQDVHVVGRDVILLFFLHWHAMYHGQALKSLVPGFVVQPFGGRRRSFVWWLWIKKKTPEGTTGAMVYFSFYQTGVF